MKELAEITSEVEETGDNEGVNGANTGAWV